jgi:UDP-hydrolysing UDP-N-acetyl-D-glucosamine 2-epimerase
VARSDYSGLLPVLRGIQAEPGLALNLIVAGMHLSPEFGLTARAVESDGFEIGDRVEMSLASDSPEGIAKSMGLGTIGFAQAYSRCRPDILLVLGDRFEMHAAVVAAVPFQIPVAHIHGGELTEGAFDDSLRHSITKMSHLHFAAAEVYGQRIIQMGEEPWRVVVSGAPTLDNISQMTFLSRSDLEKAHGLNLPGPFLLVTYHPVTLELERTEMQVEGLLAALGEVDSDVVFTYPNADPDGRTIIDKINAFSEKNRRAQVAVNLGVQGYFSTMKHATAMVGNSSSGIAEAASFDLPVVNIGNRQKGRIRNANIIDVGYSKHEILAGIEKAASEQFRSSAAKTGNIYGDGHATESIVSTLKDIPIDDRLLTKRFVDYPGQV